MWVKFIASVNISDKIDIDEGAVFEAKEEGDYIMIRMVDDSTLKAPKSEIGGILEIID